MPDKGQDGKGAREERGKEAGWEGPKKGPQDPNDRIGNGVIGRGEAEGDQETESNVPSLDDTHSLRKEGECGEESQAVFKLRRRVLAAR